MGFNFDRFEHVGTSFVPKISIRSSGVIGISQGALRKFGLLEGNWFVVLHYDREARVIGMKPTKNSSEIGAVKIVKRTHTASNGNESIIAHISARSFLEFYDIEYRDKTKRYIADWSPENEMIIVDLKQQKGGT